MLGIFAYKRRIVQFGAFCTVAEKISTVVEHGK